MQKSYLDSDKIKSFLTENAIFTQVDKRCLNKLSESMEVMTLHGGEALMHQGDPADCMYIVYQGRLEAKINVSNNQSLVVGEIGAGSVVGEMALLTQEPRSATVTALRDTILLRLTQATFDKLSLKYPKLTTQIASFCIRRLSLSMSQQKKVATIATITVLFNDKEAVDMQLAKKMISLLQNYGKVLMLTHALIKQHFPNLQLHDDRVIAWINEQEQHYDYVVYVSDVELNDWTHLCIRQADSIVVFACAHHKPELSKTIQQLASYSKNIHIYTILALLYHKDTQVPTQTHHWLQLFNWNNHVHIRSFRTADLARLMRIITGNSIGLVLGSGGARGMAHIGMIKAIEELKIPIDFVGGCSMGSVVAGFCGLEFDSEQMMELAEKTFIPGTKFDFTLPYLSLTTGRRLVHTFQKGYGYNTQIEDLWINMFAVSCNVSSNKLVVHETGSLWKAIRASSSLPVIYPPVYSQGELLVDGAILNDLPVDVMQQQVHGGKVLASVILKKNKKEKMSKLPAWFSGWSVLWQKLFSEKGQGKLLSIDDLIMRVMMLSSASNQTSMIKMADYCIYHDMSDYSLLDFKHYKAIIQKGYENALAQLETLKL